MKLSFDLISDLHVETWPKDLDWSGQATSMLCVVAGDVSRDRQQTIDALTHLGQCYRAVFYIDGNSEHRWTLQDLGDSYRSLVKEISDIPNVIYLQDNVVIVDGVAFIGTNGWWTFDMDPSVDYDQSRLWFQERYQINSSTVDQVEAMALQDFAYLSKSIAKLQMHQDVKKIVVVTHTVPYTGLVEHDQEISGTYRINCVGNSHMLKVLDNDTENKIDTWCFGHYHQDLDLSVHDVRFVSNPRGCGDTIWSKSVYYPKRIDISF